MKLTKAFGAQSIFKDDAGYTVLELVIVVLVISILVAILFWL